MGGLRDVRLVARAPTCGNCYIRRLCLPAGLDTAGAERLAALIRRRGPLKRGETVCQAGRSATSLYAVQTGALKTLKVAEDGREQIIGFHLAGDLIGLDAIDSSVHSCSAVALENTWVCELPYLELEALSRHIPLLQRALLNAFSQELVAAQSSLMTTRALSSEERVLGVLADICRRLRMRFGGSGAFRLPMTRSDLGNYVGLTAETVSRVLIRLQEQGVIACSGRTVRILDPEAAQGNCR